MWPLSTSLGVRINRQLSLWKQADLIALTFVLLGLVGVVDYFTGYELSVLIFYLGPVAVAAWYVNHRFSAMISYVSVGVWILGDLGAGAIYPNKIVLVWNAAIALGIFLLVGSLLASLRASLRDLESRVRQRTVALTEEMTQRARLEREVLEISEREQRRIGHDLHDGLGQHLTATALAGQVLGDKLSAHGQAEAVDAERIVGLIEDAIELTRNLARGLSPVAVEAEGLAVALAELARHTTAQFYLPCEFHCELSTTGTDPVTAMHLYRIAQESISNAVRHGRAGRIEIALTEDEEQRLTLTIRDDGIGLPVAAERRREGQGLHIMAHRASLIDAALDVHRDPAGGTVVRCVVVPGPVTAHARDDDERDSLQLVPRTH